MAVGMVVYQVGDLEILAVAVPMVQHEVLIVLDPLPASGADSILRLMYLCREGGG